MTDWNSRFLWDFPGGEIGVAIAVGIGLLLIIVSYFFTLRKLPVVAKGIFILIRVLFLITLIFCLCNPRIEKTKSVKSVKDQKIAVIFDVSSSMNIPGFWDKTRLEDAMSYWKNKTGKDVDNITFDYFSFGEQFKAHNSLNEILRKAERIDMSASETFNINTVDTFFYKNVAVWCSSLQMDGYNGVICFSDGIDTSEVSIDAAIKALNRSGLRHIFIPVVTELPSRAHAVLKKVETETKAPVGTDVAVTVIIQFSNIRISKSVSLILKDSSGKILEDRKVKRYGNSGTVVSKLNIPGKGIKKNIYTMDLKVNGNEFDSVTWSLQRFIPQKRRKVLLYQGALDWGTKFLKYAFMDSKHSFEVRFAPSVIGDSVTGTGANFPDIKALNEYDTVILLNLNRSQINREMELRLKKFLQNGGGVLFITGNPMVAKEFANSEIEKLLPVVFNPKYNATKRYDYDTRKFLERSKRNRRPNSYLIRKFYRRKEHKLKVPKLKKFSLTREGKASPLFLNPENNAKVIPCFQDCAFVSKIKPGAVSLAYYKDKKGKKNVLMAVQRFGLGRSAVMVTDPLWRWKLACHSSDRSHDIFWNNLVDWLGGGKEKSSRWSLPSVLLPSKKSSGVYYIADGQLGENVKFYLERDSHKYPLTVRATEKAGRYKAIITPEGKDKTLKLIAEKINNSGKAEIEATALFSVNREILNLELMMLKPNISAFHQLATVPSVKVIEFSKRIKINEWFQPEKSSNTLKEVKPLWHRGILFGLMLGLFLLEMVIRRFYKLV